MWLFALYLPSLRVKMMPLVLVLFGRFTTVPICQTRYKNTNIWTVTQSTAVLYCLVTNNRSAYILSFIWQSPFSFVTACLSISRHFWHLHSCSGRYHRHHRHNHRLDQFVKARSRYDASPLLVAFPLFPGSQFSTSILYMSYICNVFVLCCIVFVMFFKCICNVFVCFSLFSGSQASTVLYWWSILYCHLIIFVMCM